MAGKRWIGAVLVAATAVMSPRAGAADADTRPAATQPIEIGDYVRRLARDLKEATPASRYEAAQRLVAINRPDARADMTAALASSDDRERLAAARAAADAPAPDTAWITPLSNQLDRAQAPEPAGYAAQALARFDEEPRAYESLMKSARTKQPGQIPSITALGRVVQKRVAGQLLGQMNDPNESGAVHQAAADALAEMSPQTDRTLGMDTWTRWWNERNTLNEQAWRARVVAEQHRFFELADARTDQRIARMRNTLYRALDSQYEQSNRKSDYLLGLLNDPVPDVRAAGAQIIPDAVNANVPLKADLMDRLEALIHDASPDVRLAVAGAIYSRYDTNAFDPIVMQLKVERDLRVKEALVQSLGHMDARAALPVLQGLLRDPSEPVASTAAKALASLAPSFNGDPQTRQVMFDNIRQVLIDRTGPPGQPRADASFDLRAALVLALGPTADWNNSVEMVQLFRQFIDEQPSVVRQAAATALAPAGTNARTVLTDRLNPNAEPDPDVRRAAAESLGAMKSFVAARALLDSTRVPPEPSPAVREAAWQSLQRLLPYGDPVELSGLTLDFKNHHEPDRWLVVQRVVAGKTDARSKPYELQTVGDILLTELKQPRDAIQPYRDALKLYRQQAGANTPFALVNNLLNAYLGANQIDPAINYCREQIGLDERTKDGFGQILAATAEKWGASRNPAEREQARTLITQSLTLDLDEQYKERLRDALRKLPPPPASMPATSPAEASR